MNEALVALLAQILETAAGGLFENLAVEVGAGESSAQVDHDVACSIGFASPLLRGSLTLTAGQAFIANCRPIELRAGEASPEDISDWIGELGNQLLGRFKNRLIAHGVAVELGTPAVLYGFQIQRHSSRMPIACQTLVRSASGTLIAYIDAHAAPEFRIEEVLPANQAMPEGELELF